jgi:hypothetical protein
MKHINIVFENKEYQDIIKWKNKMGLSWHDFILTLINLHMLEENEKKEK